MSVNEKIHVLKQTKQLRALHSIVRNRDTCQADFVFYSNRIIRQLLETSLDLLPFEGLNVTTPIGEIYEGLAVGAKLCAVSVIRAGESMEHELVHLERGMPIGKILIQRDKTTKQPKYYYSHLPDDISERHVLLLEPMLATGGSAIAAIDLLLKKGVLEQNIIFVNLLASPDGIERLTQKYPQLYIVTSSIERELNSDAYMIPGIGDFGDRYFGTQQVFR